MTIGLLAVSAAAIAAPPDPDDPINVGYRIYEQGVLPDGKPLVAIRPEGFSLEGRSATCVTCHRRSGMGSVEGQLKQAILVPPVAGSLLFAPSRFNGSFLDYIHHKLPNEAWIRPLTRSAYDEASLARALREGVDPDGKPLHAPMPRYALDDGAVATFFQTDPQTLIAEHGDSVSLMYLQPSGSGTKYQGRNETFWEHQGEALITWGYGAPQMRCKKTE